MGCWVESVHVMQAPGAAAASTVISFAQKIFANGTLTSKLHVIELGAAPGMHSSHLSGKAIALHSMKCPAHEEQARLNWWPSLSAVKWE